MIWFFTLLMYLLFAHKELLCFHKPLLLVPSDLVRRETIIGEWSFKKQLKHQGFLQIRKTLDMKK